jgi:plasmid stabilization system protein ParE
LFSTRKRTPISPRNLGLHRCCNLAAADRVREEIYEAIQSIVPFPYVGHSRPDLTSKPLRFQIVREYVIAYAPEEKPLAVIAVLHARRNPRVIAAILRNRG